MKKALCSKCTYPSIHFFVSRSRSVAGGAHIQAFTFLIDEDTLKITVGCLVCACGVCGACGVLCFCMCVCVWCEAWHALSLSCSLSFLLSLHLSSLSFLTLLFPFHFLSHFSFSLFFFFFLCSCSFSCSLFFLFFFSLLFSPPNTMKRTDQPTRRLTSSHLNMIWRRASAQQSVPSFSSHLQEGTFY